MKSILFRAYAAFASFVSRLGLRNSRAARAAHRFIYRTSKPSRVTVHGLTLYVHPSDTVIADRLIRSGTWEPFETEVFLEQVSRTAGIVVDIGANIGYYTLLAARRGAAVVAFEPDPENAALLRKNVRENGFEASVEVVQKAVWDRTGSERLYTSPDNRGDHRLYSSGDDRESLVCDTVRLDDFFGSRDTPIGLVKIDAQGAEGRVLKGMRRTLERNRSAALLIEFSPNLLALLGDDPDEGLADLARHGFDLFVIDEEHARLEPLDIRRVPTDGVNLLCLPRGRSPFARPTVAVR